MTNIDPLIFKDSPVHLKNVFNNLPTWEDAILDFDFNVQNYPDEVKDLGSLGIVTHRGNHLEKVRNLVDIIHSFRPDEEKCTAHLYMSLLSTSTTFGWHKDDVDVFYIQAQGEMIWETDTDRVTEYKLQAGDMIYIPKYVLHNTKPITPRLGISIGFR